MSDVLGTEELLAEPLRERRAQRLAAMTSKQFMQPLDIARPQPRTPVGEFGELIKGRPAEFEQMLALQVALGV